MHNKDDVMAHLKEHQTYPATKEELMAECDNLSHFSAEDKKRFNEELPKKTYNSAEEVMAELKME